MCVSLCVCTPRSARQADGFGLGLRCAACGARTGGFVDGLFFLFIGAFVRSGVYGFSTHTTVVLLACSANLNERFLGWALVDLCARSELCVASFAL